MAHTSAQARQEDQAPADWFTGAVFMRPVLNGQPPSRLRVVEVRFTAGARTNWHTHPLGQTLYVLSGRGRAQIEGDAVVEFGPGDTLTFPADTRHWHGAAPGGEMIHLAMQEEEPGTSTNWQEPVTDAQYGG